MDHENESHQPAHHLARPPTPSEEIHISKKALWLGLGFLIAALAGILLWQLGGINQIKYLIAPARAKITVVDTATNQPVTGAQVTVAGQTAITDDKGALTLNGLTAGSQTLAVKALNYVPYSQSVQLKRGENNLAAKLVLSVEKVSLSGSVKDQVSQDGVSGAQVKTKYGATQTQAGGDFTLENVPVSEVEFTVEKSGFEKKTQKVAVKKGQDVALTLTPSGRTIFVSNREGGKRGIYTTRYDGSDTKQLIKRTGDTEDFSPIASPDDKYVAFLSTREKRPVENGPSGYTPSLYLISTDGQNLAQLSRDYHISNIAWSSNSQTLAWTGASASDGSSSSSYLYIYRTTGKQTETVSTSGDTWSFVFNHKGTGLAWFQGSASGDLNADSGLYYRKIANANVTKIDSTASEFAFTNDDSAIQYKFYDPNGGKPKDIQYTISSGNKGAYTPSPYVDSPKVVSPDGAKYAFTSIRDGKIDIFISDPDGKNEQRLTTLGTVSGSVRWSQNSRYVLFDSTRPAETARYIVGLTGHEPLKITDIHLVEGLGSGY